MTDEHLISRDQTHRDKVSLISREEFEEFVRAHSNRLYAVIFRILRQHESTEDVLHDALLKVWDKRAEFSKVDNQLAWVTTICKNRALDKLRRDKHGPSGVIGQEDRRTELSYYDPDCDFGEESATSKILNAAKKLKDEQQTVIRMRFLEGLSVKKISTELGITPRAVSISLYRGLEVLRKDTQLRSQLLENSHE